MLKQSLAPVILLATILTFLVSPISRADFVAEWDQAEALKRMQSDSVVVIDVRSPGEYAEGHVPGAINIPHNQLDEHASTLAELKDKDLLIYCRSGRRADMAQSALSEKGFNNLYHLKGDMQGWKAANLKIEK